MDVVSATNESQASTHDPPPWLDREAYPFASNFLELDGVGRLHYVDEGEGDAILMVHGQPTWSFMYRHVIRALSANHRCIAVDHIGFGLSDKPRHWSYLPEEHAAHLGMLLDHLGVERTSLLVHDWGGPIGLGFAIAEPERIESIVCLDTWMWSMREHTWARVFSGVLGSQLGCWATRRFNLFITQMMGRAFSPRDWRRIEAAYRGPFLREDDRQGCALFPRMLVHPWLAGLWEQRESLREIPCLLIWSDRDPAFPAAAP
jgi:haloalkane dehalogenase